MNLGGLEKEEMEEEEGKTGGVRSRFVAPGAKLGQAARRDSAAAPPPPPPLPDAPTPQNPLNETSINVDFEIKKIYRPMR